MSRSQDVVLFIRNMFRIDNVYECARPFLLVFGLFGIGASWVGKVEGVYTLQNTSYSKLISVLMSVIFLPIHMMLAIIAIFHFNLPSLFLRVYNIVAYFVVFSTTFTNDVGYLMTYVSRKHLDRVFAILHNVDGQMEAVNIGVTHWQVTLKVTVLALATIDYPDLARRLPAIRSNYMELVWLLPPILTHLFFVWVILFLVIIQQRFGCLIQLLQQNATVTNVHIVGERHLRDNYILRRVSLARHVHEQLTEVVQLFSDSCRYMIAGLLTASTIKILLSSIWVFTHPELRESFLIVTQTIRIVILIHICQMDKNQRRVLAARLRHLCAFETNRELVHQVQQYIMFNANCTTSIVDFQFTDIDNVLLLTIIDVVASNMLVIYSYTRPEAQN